MRPEPEAPVLVLGVDPGTAATGFGVVGIVGNRVSLVECGVIRTSPREPLPLRIRQIFEGINRVLERHHPEAMAVENVFYGKNVRSALTLGHARGAILLAAELSSVSIAEYSPREIKKAVVGFGGATKDQVGFMVQRQLRLKHAPSPSDAADGVATALCHCLSRNAPTLEPRT